jgi:hypothetical protein
VHLDRRPATPLLFASFLYSLTQWHAAFICAFTCAKFASMHLIKPQWLTHPGTLTSAEMRSFKLLRPQALCHVP